MDQFYISYIGLNVGFTVSLTNLNAASEFLTQTLNTKCDTIQNQIRTKTIKRKTNNTKINKTLQNGFFHNRWRELQESHQITNCVVKFLDYICTHMEITDPAMAVKSLCFQEVSMKEQKFTSQMSLICPLARQV